MLGSSGKQSQEQTPSKLKKIYVEITNVCNFDCSFCFKTRRPAGFMSVEEFRLVAEKIRPFSDYVYLHVLGEPLLHPELDGILTVAESAGLQVNIDTNGSLISEKKELLLSRPVRQIVVSLHDAQENIAQNNWDAYLQKVLDFASDIAPKTYVCLRLSNMSNASSADFNALCLDRIAERFGLSPGQKMKATGGNGATLAEHVFLQLRPRFEWPCKDRPLTQTRKTCHALRDHIAILVQGQVVPCCLDADAEMKLGDIFTDELSRILKSERATKIRKGFMRRKTVEPICAACGFIVD